MGDIRWDPPRDRFGSTDRIPRIAEFTAGKRKGETRRLHKKSLKGRVTKSSGFSGARTNKGKLVGGHVNEGEPSDWRLER